MFDSIEYCILGVFYTLISKYINLKLLFVRRRRNWRINKLKIYKISDDYIEYLRQFEDTISLNKDNKRSYIGVVFVINNMIPVVDSELIKIDINKIEYIAYKNLLQNQYRYLEGKKIRLLTKL